MSHIIGIRCEACKTVRVSGETQEGWVAVRPQPGTQGGRPFQKNNVTHLCEECWKKATKALSVNVREIRQVV